MPRILRVFSLICLIPLGVQAFDGRLQIGTEAGFLNRSAQDSQTMLRLIARYRLIHSTPEGRFLLKLRLAPEGYLAAGTSSILRNHLSMRYSRNAHSGRWEFSLITRAQTYSLLESEKQSYLYFWGEIGYRRITPGALQWALSVQPLYRVIDAIPAQRLASIKVSPHLNFPISDMTGLEFGILGEPYGISGDTSIVSGFRFGSFINYRRKQNPLLNLSYHLLYDFNDYRNGPSPQHHIEVLIGQPIGKRWSIFFFINYDLLPESEGIPVEVIYTPLNTQNWIYLQGGYDFSLNKEVYLRGGYVYEEVHYGLQTIQGWQVIFGLNFSY